jgi:hypothetical protein
MINSIPRKSAELSAEIEAQTECFIAKGGKIRQCGSEDNANIVPRLVDFVMNSKAGAGIKKKPTDQKKAK